VTPLSFQSRERNERSEVATGLRALGNDSSRGTQSGRYFATLVALPALKELQQGNIGSPREFDFVPLR